MRRRVAAAVAGAALAVPAVVLAQSSGPGPYDLPQATPSPAPGAASPPAPALGEVVVLEPVSGRVSYRVPGRRYVRLGEPVEVPMETVVDARRGRVRLVVARDRSGGRWRSVFFDGKFRLDQEAKGRRVTTLTLAGGSFADCKKASTSRRPANDAAPKRVRRLWGDGKGRFRTSGRYSAATVRGTRWLVEDRCDGTLTRVARGEVEVEDFAPVAGPQPTTPEQQTGGGEGGGEDDSGQAPAMAPRKPKVVRVRKGGSYVARPG
jgi:hypothetical protein